MHSNLFYSITFLASIFAIQVDAQINGLVGGINSTGDGEYSAYIDSIGRTVGDPITGLPPISPDFFDSIYSVSINDFRQGLIGGVDDSNAAYAAFVNPTTNAVETVVTGLPGVNGIIFGVSINDSGLGLLAGEDAAGDAYAAFVDSSNTLTPITGLPSNAGLLGAAINNSGLGLIGGANASNASYAAFVDITNTVIPIPGLPGTNSSLTSVAINNSGLGLLGGQISSSKAAYAAFVDTTNTVTPIPGLPSGGLFTAIYCVAINDFGQGLIGGTNGSNKAYAAFVDIANPSVLTQITGISPTSTEALCAALNNFGQGLLGGTFGLLVIDPNTNIAIPITLSDPNATLLGVSLVNNPQLPITCLSGNYLRFAKYLNQHGLRNIFYFIPALCNEDFKKALQSAAPMRNAFSLFAADNNMFFLNHGLSLHLRNHRHFRHRKLRKEQQPSMALGNKNPSIYLASVDALPHATPEASIENVELAIEKPADIPSESLEENETEQTTFHHTLVDKHQPYTLWFEGIGAFASQKAQQQTVGFDPKTGGFIFAFDKMATEHSLVGGGLPYTFTHVSEDENQGHSNINQEYLFLYASWENYGMYLDGALWSAIFQTHQVRNIHLIAFDFTSTSNPQGFQLSPHVEFGYDYIGGASSSFDWIIDPFAMLDWVNAWQQSYQEKGHSPFNIEQKAHYSSFLRAEVGLRFYETFSFDSWRLVLQEKGSYVNKTPFNVGKINAVLVGFPGSFTVETLTTSQNLGVAEMSFIFEPIDHRYPYGSLSYQGEFCPSYQSHQISAEVSWDF